MCWISAPRENSSTSCSPSDSSQQKLSRGRAARIIGTGMVLWVVAMVRRRSQVGIVVVCGASVIAMGLLVYQLAMLGSRKEPLKAERPNIQNEADEFRSAFPQWESDFGRVDRNSHRPCDPDPRRRPVHGDRDLRPRCGRSGCGGAGDGTLTATAVVDTRGTIAVASVPVDWCR